MSNIKFTIITFAALVLMFAVSLSVYAAGDLKSYVQKDDGAFEYSLEKIQLYNNKQVSVTTFNMTSQKWQGEEWKHTVQVYYPAQCSMSGTALMVVTGGNPSKDKVSTLVQACAALSAPVVILYNIPNQPLFDKNEDALIAYTFSKAAEENNFSEWPLLFPMVKSVVKAMDMVEEFTKDNFASAISQFVVTGASKRGWTTWLSAGSGDARVCGIIPLVFDFLKFPEQLKHETESYSGLSEQLGDYSNINITELIDSPAGKQLVESVDPFSYNNNMTCSKLLINGTNDQYWTLDSASLYFDELKGNSNFLFYMVNGNHSAGDLNVNNFSTYLNTIKMFMKHCSGEASMQNIKWTWSEEGDNIICNIKVNPSIVQSIKTYDAESPRRDFRNVRWSAGQKFTKDTDGFVFSTKKPKGSYKGAFVEVGIYTANGAYTLFTTPYIFDGTK